MSKPLTRSKETDWRDSVRVCAAIGCALVAGLFVGARSLGHGGDVGRITDKVDRQSETLDRIADELAHIAQVGTDQVAQRRRRRRG